MTDFVVGDVHGCIRELELVLERVHFDPRTDTLWSVGDLVGRGPESLAVLRFVESLGDRFATVLGNHDLHLLSVLTGVKAGNPKDKTDDIVTNAGDWVDWLRYQPLLIQIPNCAVAISHAGLFPGWQLSEAQQYADEVAEVLQHTHYTDFLRAMYHNDPSHWHPDLPPEARFRFIVNSFTRMRYCSADTGDGVGLDLQCKLPPSQAPKTIKPWFNFLPPQPIQLVFGHWAALNGATERADIIGLDTGCVWGNGLSLYNCQSGETVFQPALHK
ncbi:symmetrical bis(5'-nucleosyl)-tetraphosphatase [Aliidiomarina maris]|uniref:bis(5'-nucleosyl)-tetraphosphatase (symmetrical) n=1 Tax=Aliidiomarina maris TaxID=531312 RepID=A0A327WU33_9GAMM|nr:symmetrical bis(5'-nucleosyl)-tetraphosphatase [Aliidiomarina maris]RAJ94954.1 bis(5'nucleosyl)-tetraphosphatase ApaH [Aliidiomarina maris]RUO22163.1 hypothetical protein CWE07_11295 [Aliidiomarina maris]